MSGSDPTGTGAGGRDAGDRASTTRRTFLTLAGSAAGVGLSGAQVSAGPTADGTDVQVVAARAQRASVRDAAGSLRDGGSRQLLTVDVGETTTGADRFATGDADVLVGSRPLLPEEHETALDHGVDYERREVPTAVAALRHPESTWIECLSPAQLTETWGSAGAVETWAEVPDGDAVPDGGTDAPQPPGSPGGAPADAGTPLVRGVREFQYATGFGGTGYYRPAADWLDDRSGRGRDDATTLVRLAFVYASRSALRRGPVANFLSSFTGRSDRRIGQRAYVGRPG